MGGQSRRVLASRVATQTRPRADPGGLMSAPHRSRTLPGESPQSPASPGSMDAPARDRRPARELRRAASARRPGAGLHHPLDDRARRRSRPQRRRSARAGAQRAGALHHHAEGPERAKPGPTAAPRQASLAVYEPTPGAARRSPWTCRRGASPTPSRPRRPASDPAGRVRRNGTDRQGRRPVQDGDGPSGGHEPGRCRRRRLGRRPAVSGRAPRQGPADARGPLLQGRRHRELLRPA